MDRQVYDTLVAAQQALFESGHAVAASGCGGCATVVRIAALLTAVSAVTDSSVGQRGCAVCGAKSALSITVCPEHAGIVAAQTVG